MAKKKKAKGISWSKAIRWVVLLGLVAVIVLLFVRPAPPSPPLSPDETSAQAARFEEKLRSLESSRSRGEPAAPVRFNSSEVAAFLAVAAKNAQALAPEGGATGSTPETQLAFEGDEVIAQTVAERFGRDIVVTVRGRISVEDGFLRFHPTAFAIGRVPMPTALVEGRLREKLDEPQNRERLRLPEYIADMRVENGELVIVEK